MKFHNKPYTFVELVELKVTNLENSLTFYQEVVGFKVLEKTATYIRMTAHLLIGWGHALFSKNKRSLIHFGN